MKAPKYIRNKMHRLAKLCAESNKLSEQINEWFGSAGYDLMIIRCGDGYSLEEIEYGNDITDIFCERIERGELMFPSEGEENT